MQKHDYTEMSMSDLNGRISDLLTQYTALNLSVDSPDEDIATAEELAAEVSALGAERERRVTEAQAREQRLASVGEAFAEAAAVEEAEAPVEDTITEEAEADEVVEETAVEEEPVAEVTETVETVAEVTEDVVAEEAPEAIAAAAETPSDTSPTRRAAAFAPEVKMPKASNTAVLTAAADVPGYPNGQNLDGLTAAAGALISRMKGMPTHAQSDIRQRYGAAVIQVSADPELVQDGQDDYSLVQRVGDETRLPGGSLTAAGGWCAPSETMYDLLSYESLDGLLQLPEMQVTRGGIRYTPGPDFSDIYTDCIFHQTEAQAIAGTPKTCCEVTCPSFSDVRLDAVGACIKAPILTTAAYPELTRRYIEAALVAVQHKVNAEVIADIVAAGGAAVTPAGQGTLLFTLDYLEWQATSMRYAYRLSTSQTIEVVAPLWLKPLMRAELARRTGVAGWSVSDAQLNEYFSVRGLSVQFVYGKSDLTSFPTLESVPASVDVAMYPSGTWVKGMADVINLDAVYDATNLESNVYTAVFAEWGVLAVQRSTATQNVTIPIDVKGLTGQLTDVALGSAPAAPAA